MKKSVWGMLGLVVAVAGTMGAAPLTVTTFMATDGAGANENPMVDGVAKLVYSPNSVNGPHVEAHIHLYNLVPNAVYGVDIFAQSSVDFGGGGKDTGGTIVANESGRANVHISFPVQCLFAPDVTTICVYRDIDSNNEFSVDEERALAIEGM
jgi:hypothetical protein